MTIRLIVLAMRYGALRCQLVKVSSVKRNSLCYADCDYVRGLAFLMSKLPHITPTEQQSQKKNLSAQIVLRNKNMTEKLSRTRKFQQPNVKQ